MAFAAARLPGDVQRHILSFVLVCCRCARFLVRDRAQRAIQCVACERAWCVPCARHRFCVASVYAEVLIPMCARCRYALHRDRPLRRGWLLGHRPGG